MAKGGQTVQGQVCNVAILEFIVALRGDHRAVVAAVFQFRQIHLAPSFWAPSFTSWRRRPLAATPPPGRWFWRLVSKLRRPAAFWPGSQQCAPGSWRPYRPRALPHRAAGRCGTSLTTAVLLKKLTLYLPSTCGCACNSAAAGFGGLRNAGPADRAAPGAATSDKRLARGIIHRAAQNMVICTSPTRNNMTALRRWPPGRGMAAPAVGGLDSWLQCARAGDVPAPAASPAP